jgi:hypothetical protein
MLELFLRALRQPEYIHTLLNPLPIYGLGVGLLGLMIALLLRSRPAQIATLAIILVCSSAAWPVYVFGEKAEDRMEGIVDDAGRRWLHEHEERAEKIIYAFYALALLTVVALLAPLRWPGMATPLSLAVLVLSMVALGLGGYIAQAGGKIRHPEFRTELPPEEVSEREDSSQRGRGRGRGRGGGN